jgi:hypothetical protein
VTPSAKTLDRTDGIDKQGSIELYLDKKRPAQSDPITPQKRIKLSETTHELTSVQNIVSEFEKQAHQGLINVFRGATFVGCATAEISLIQHETKLYAIHMRNISSAFMFQVRSYLCNISHSIVVL